MAVGLCALRVLLFIVGHFCKMHMFMVAWCCEKVLCIVSISLLCNCKRDVVFSRGYSK